MTRLCEEIGKNWGCLSKIEQNTTDNIIFSILCTSYIQNYLIPREYTPSHIWKQKNVNQNVTKFEVTN